MIKKVSTNFVNTEKPTTDQNILDSFLCCLTNDLQVPVSSKSPQLGAVDFFFVEYGGIPSLFDSSNINTVKQV